MNESIAEPPEDAEDSVFEQSTVLEQTVLEPLPIIETNNNRIEIPQKFLPLKKYQKETMKPPKMIKTCKDLLAKEGSKFSENGKNLLQNVVAQMETDFQEIKGNGAMTLILISLKRLQYNYIYNQIIIVFMFQKFLFTLTS